MARRQEDLLPVAYFHLVFTLPHALNNWVQLHPSEIYKLLFNTVWQTLKSFGRDPKRLNGELGMTAVLHTWGQNLSRHVHLHCLFPVKALSRHFRGKMASALRDAINEGKLPRLGDTTAVNATLDSLMPTPWVVFARGTWQHTDTILA